MLLIDDAKNTQDGPKTRRKAWIKVKGAGPETKLKIDSLLEGQTGPIQESYDPYENTFTLALEGNSYQEFRLINL